MKKTIIAALILAASAMSSANAETITFNSLEHAGSGYTNLENYSELGFTISAGSLASAYQGTGGWYAGSAGMFNNGGGDTTTLSKISGGVFSLNAIDLARVSTSYAGNALVSFVGYKHGGGTVSQSFNVGDALAFSTFSFIGFTNLDSVSWIQDSPYHQFDNIVLDAAAVPEPASLALFGLGLVGFAAARRRKSAQKAA